MFDPFFGEIFGVMAATMTMLSGLPQAVKTIRTKSAKDLSWGTCLLLFFGVFFWFLYGKT